MGKSFDRNTCSTITRSAYWNLMVRIAMERLANHDSPSASRDPFYACGSKGLRAEDYVRSLRIQHADNPRGRFCEGIPACLRCPIRGNPILPLQFAVRVLKVPHFHQFTFEPLSSVQLICVLFYLCKMDHRRAIYPMMHLSFCKASVK